MSLTHTNIIEIINACKGHVKSLKIKGTNIEVEFVVPHQSADQTTLTHNHGSEVMDIEEDFILKGDDIISNIEVPIDDKILDEQEQIYELNITDPFLMEEMIARKEVTRETKND